MRAQEVGVTALGDDPHALLRCQLDGEAADGACGSGHQEGVVLVQLELIERLSSGQAVERQGGGFDR
ncbi:hypothetical protein ACFVJS_15580 [Nocardioides sp. NPDC057772]|uniref:hypothetical protein n=1 Tax=Nocardioides sp. NPDC057772 TaxID=3346245 RepID=UPI00366FFEFE